MTKINIVEEFEDIYANEDDDNNTVIIENEESNINCIKKDLTEIENKLEGLNNIYNNLKNVDDKIITDIENKLDSYKKNKDEFLRKFGGIEIELIHKQKRVDELNSQIQRLNIEINQAICNKNKILYDYELIVNSEKKIKYIYQRYGKKQILETFKNYSNFHNIDLNDVSLNDILNSSAGFEGWYNIN